MDDREREIAALVAQQRADDTPRQRPEEYGGDHGTVVLSVDGVGLPDLSTDLDGVAVSGSGFGGDYDEARGPALRGRYRQRSAAPLWAHVEDANSEAARVVREALAEMTEEQRETYRLVFGERLSYREAADRLGVHFTSVRDRVETLKRIVTRALVQAGGGDPEAVS